jgi:NAD(P)-dependent dehydrogenase (short-subunit alcohol dehydrogenase family)
MVMAMPPRPDRRVVLITGASSGIGRACAERLHARGYTVYGTSRRPADHPDLPFSLLEMDVSQDESVRRGVEEVLRAEGRIDVVINNSGIVLAGAIEDTTPGEARDLFETNFFGVVRACRAVLPAMRARRSGLIVTIGSIGGRMAMPFQAYYSASKFALDGFTRAVRIEVRRFGVQAVLIEPGDTRTPITFNRRWSAAAQNGSPYDPDARRAVGIMAVDEQHGTPPEQVARVVERAIAARRPRLRYAVGPLHEVIGAAVARLLPDGLVEAALMLYYRIRSRE